MFINSIDFNVEVIIMNSRKEIKNNIINMSSETLIDYIFELNKKANSKRFGLIWEEQPEDIDNLMKKNIPYLIFDEKRSIINKSLNNNLLVEADNYQFLKISLQLNNHH